MRLKPPHPPSILKRGGLKSSGQRLISSNSKTERIAFFQQKKNSFLIFTFKREVIFGSFEIFSNFLFVDLSLNFFRILFGFILLFFFNIFIFFNLLF